MLLVKHIEKELLIKHKEDYLKVHDNKTRKNNNR
jgi:hypothetical protein